MQKSRIFIRNKSGINVFVHIVQNFKETKVESLSSFFQPLTNLTKNQKGTSNNAIANGGEQKFELTHNADHKFNLIFISAEGRDMDGNFITLPIRTEFISNNTTSVYTIDLTPSDIRNIFKAFELISYIMLFPHSKTGNAFLKVLSNINQFVVSNSKLVDQITTLEEEFLYFTASTGYFKTVDMNLFYIASIIYSEILSISMKNHVQEYFLYTIGSEKNIIRYENRIHLELKKKPDTMYLVDVKVPTFLDYSGGLLSQHTKHIESIYSKQKKSEDIILNMRYIFNVALMDKTESEELHILPIFLGFYKNQNVIALPVSDAKIDHKTLLSQYPVLHAENVWNDLDLMTFSSELISVSAKTLFFFKLKKEKISFSLPVNFTEDIKKVANRKIISKNYYSNTNQAGQNFEKQLSKNFSSQEISASIQQFIVHNLAKNKFFNFEQYTSDPIPSDPIPSDPIPSAPAPIDSGGGLEDLIDDEVGFIEYKVTNETAMDIVVFSVVEDEGDKVPTLNLLSTQDGTEIIAHNTSVTIMIDKKLSGSELKYLLFAINKNFFPVHLEYPCAFNVSGQEELILTEEHTAVMQRTAEWFLATLIPGDINQQFMSVVQNLDSSNPESTSLEDFFHSDESGTAITNESYRAILFYYSHFPNAWVSKCLNSQSIEIGLFSIQGNKRVGTLSIVLGNNTIESVVAGTAGNDASVTFIDQEKTSFDLAFSEVDGSFLPEEISLILKIKLTYVDTKLSVEGILDYKSLSGMHMMDTLEIKLYSKSQVSQLEGRLRFTLLNDNLLNHNPKELVEKISKRGGYLITFIDKENNEISMQLTNCKIIPLEDTVPIVDIELILSFYYTKGSEEDLNLSLFVEGYFKQKELQGKYSEYVPSKSIKMDVLLVANDHKAGLLSIVLGNNTIDDIIVGKAGTDAAVIFTDNDKKSFELHYQAGAATESSYFIPDANDEGAPDFKIRFLYNEPNLHGTGNLDTEEISTSGIIYILNVDLESSSDKVNYNIKEGSLKFTLLSTDPSDILKNDSNKEGGYSIVFLDNKGNEIPLQMKDNKIQPVDGTDTLTLDFTHKYQENSTVLVFNFVGTLKVEEPAGDITMKSVWGNISFRSESTSTSDAALVFTASGFLVTVSSIAVPMYLLYKSSSDLKDFLTSKIYVEGFGDISIDDLTKEMNTEIRGMKRNEDEIKRLEDEIRDLEKKIADAETDSDKERWEREKETKKTSLKGEEDSLNASKNKLKDWDKKIEIEFDRKFKNSLVKAVNRVRMRQKVSTELLNELSEKLREKIIDTVLKFFIKGAFRQVVKVVLLSLIGGVLGIITLIGVVSTIITVISGIIYLFELLLPRSAFSIHMDLLFQTHQDLLSVLDPIQRKSLEVQSSFQEFTAEANNANITVRKDVQDSTSELISSIQDAYTYIHNLVYGGGEEQISPNQSVHKSQTLFLSAGFKTSKAQDKLNLLNTIVIEESDAIQKIIFDTTTVTSDICTTSLTVDDDLSVASAQVHGLIQSFINTMRSKVLDSKEPTYQVILKLIKDMQDQIYSMCTISKQTEIAVQDSIDKIRTAYEEAQDKSISETDPIEMLNHTITMLSLFTNINNLSINMIKNTSDISSKIKTIIKTLPT